MFKENKYTEQDIQLQNGNVFFFTFSLPPPRLVPKLSARMQKSDPWSMRCGVSSSIPGEKGVCDQRLAVPDATCPTCQGINKDWLWISVAYPIL